MCTPTTSPKTAKFASPGNCTIWVSLHSRLAGAFATRAQAICSHSALSIPARANSSSPWGSMVELTFITSRAAYSTTFTQNTPVSRMLATESLVPSTSSLALVEANITCGGT